jgi:hypothetical protein
MLGFAVEDAPDADAMAATETSPAAMKPTNLFALRRDRRSGIAGVLHEKERRF